MSYTRLSNASSTSTRSQLLQFLFFPSFIGLLLPIYTTSGNHSSVELCRLHLCLQIDCIVDSEYKRQMNPYCVIINYILRHVPSPVLVSVYLKTIITSNICWREN